MPKTYRRQGMRVEDWEISRMVQMRGQNYAWEEIAQELGRSSNSLHQILHRERKKTRMEKVTSTNFRPMTEAEIEKFYLESLVDGRHPQGWSMDRFRQEIRDEEEAVGVLLGLGFDIAKKA